MAPIIANVQRSEEVRSLDSIGRRKAAKALLFTFGPQIWEVLVTGHGSVKAASLSMGNTDPSLLRRQIVDGTLPLKKLFEADPAALAAFGEFLTEHFGAARKTKQQIARERLPELLAVMLDAVTNEDPR